RRGRARRRARRRSRGLHQRRGCGPSGALPRSARPRPRPRGRWWRRWGRWERTSGAPRGFQRTALRLSRPLSVQKLTGSAGAAGPCNTSSINERRAMTAETGLAARKAAATAFLRMAAEGRVREAYERYIAPTFRHHNVYFKGDRESLL